MRRYVLSAILSVCAILALTGCAGIFDGGYEGDFTFALVIAKVTISPTSDYRLSNTTIGFYDYFYGGEGLPWQTIDGVRCNDTELDKDEIGVFRGQLFPVNGEEFYYFCENNDYEAECGVRLEKPQLNGIDHGDNIPVSAEYTVPYVSEDGDGIQVWCEDDNGRSKTAGEQDDDGAYEGIDTTNLIGPGRIRISRFYEDREIYDDGAMDSAILTEGEMVTIVNVVWSNSR